MKSIKESIIGRRGASNNLIAELQDGDVVVLRTGRYMVVYGDKIHGRLIYSMPDESIDIDLYNHNLIYKHHDKELDIIAVYRFTDPVAIDPAGEYVSPDLESFVNRNLAGIIHYGINTVFERK